MKIFRLGDPFPPTPEGFHLRVTSTLDGLKEEPMIKRHKIGRLVLVAALVLALLIGTALAAAGYFSGEIDWTGRHVAEDVPDEPEITEAPMEAAGEEARLQRRKEIFATQPEDEYWIIENANGTAVSPGCRKSFDSLAALNEFLQTSATDFRLITEAPDGYAFAEAYCAFYFTKEIVEGATVTEEDVGDGMTLVRIKPGDGYLPLVRSYDVDFQNPDGELISVSADFSEVGLDDYSFEVYEGDVYESLRIDGMVYALYFDRGEYRKVSMIEKTTKEKGYADLFDIASILDGSDGGATFKYIDYTIWSPSLAKDALIGLAESLE